MTVVNTARMLFIQGLGHFEKRNIENGTSKLNLEDGSVKFCIQSSIEILREQASHNDIKIEFV